jgi:hypothetical protein
MQRLGKHIPVEENKRNNRRVAFLWKALRSFTMQRCGKHTSVTLNQFATIEEAVFSVGGAPKLTRISGSCENRRMR